MEQKFFITNEWIDSDDAYPVPNRLVLIQFEYGEDSTGFAVGYFRIVDHTACFFEVISAKRLTSVVAWMELPNPFLKAPPTAHQHERPSTPGVQE